MLSDISWDLIHTYKFLLDSLKSAKKTVADLSDYHYLAININLGWLKLNV